MVLLLFQSEKEDQFIQLQPALEVVPPLHELLTQRTLLDPILQSLSG